MLESSDEASDDVLREKIYFVDLHTCIWPQDITEVNGPT